MSDRKEYLLKNKEKIAIQKKNGRKEIKRK
jgi:hypothetical protein